MAEYIDKGGLIRFLDNLQQPKIPITEGFKYISIDDAIKVVSERPAANVISIPEEATRAQIFEEVFGIGMMMAGLKNIDWWNTLYKKEAEK